MWVKVILITLFATMIALISVPAVVVCMIMKSWDWPQIKKMYKIWWTQDEDY